MTKPTYVLDNCALRSFSRDVLWEAVSAGHDVAVAPLTIYEMFRHLDEDNGDSGAFSEYKREILKARKLRILDPPGAVQARAVGAPWRAHPGQVVEPRLLKDLLYILYHSDSLKGFYGRWLSDTSGQLRQIEGSPRRAREQLAKMQNEYSEKLEELRSVLAVGDVRKAELREFGTARYWDCMKAMLMGVTNPHGGDVDENGFRRRLFCASYLHFAYLLWRLRRYVLNVGERQPLAIDPNDMVDANTCWHIDLQQPHTLVTKDKGLLDTLAEAFRQLESPQWPEVVPDVIQARAINIEQFRSEISA